MRWTCSVVSVDCGRGRRVRGLSACLLLVCVMGCGGCAGARNEASSCRSITQSENLVIVGVSVVGLLMPLFNLGVAAVVVVLMVVVAIDEDAVAGAALTSIALGSRH